MTWSRERLGRPKTVALGAVALLLLGGACAAPPPPEPVVIAYPAPPEEPRYFYERTLLGSSDVIEETAPARVHLGGLGRLSVKVGVHVPATCGHFRDCVDATA